MPDATSRPRVSVIIATYNRSSVLRYSIETALWQTFDDIEVLVIGDGCTDDSAEAVASFQDPRLQWHNLPENMGGQWAPNNAGIVMAKGDYIAYLGHDDLWLPHHLEALVAAIEREHADIAYSIAALVGEPGARFRALAGVSPADVYEPSAGVVPSTILHRASLTAETGAWRNPRSLNAPAGLDFISNIWAAGKRLARVRDLTVFKFAADWRKDVYVDRPCQEQAVYVQRMRSEPDFLFRETLAIALAYAEGWARAPVDFDPPPSGAAPGWYSDQRRRFTGVTVAGGPTVSAPLYRDGTALRQWNQREDIVPHEALAALHRGNELPADGIFLGRGWHGLEREGGGLFHWVNTDAEIVITRPHELMRIVLEAESGPGMKGKPFELLLCDEQGVRLGTATVSYRHQVSFDLPPMENAGAIFRLVAPSGGVATPPDSRLLNFRVFHLGWCSIMKNK